MPPPGGPPGPPPGPGPGPGPQQGSALAIGRLNPTELIARKSGLASSGAINASTSTTAGSSQ
ncbi:hypothetical protein D2E44_14805 [Mycobacteroides abscessus]|nr:hypothetical protein D2E44_14805 [Mycobacteroides abscessus]